MSEPNEPTLLLSAAGAWVRGQVRYADGEPAADRTVLAVHRELSGDRELGRATTDSHGAYTVSYGRSTRAVDLVVSVRDASGGVLAESPVRFAATTTEELDLTLEGAPEGSEYERLLQALGPHLDGVTLPALAEQLNGDRLPGGTHGGGGSDGDGRPRAVTLLAGKSRQPRQRIADLVAAHRFAEHSGLPPEVAYALIREGVAPDLSTVDGAADALRAAVAHGRVPAHVGRFADAVEGRLRDAAARQVAGDASTFGGALSAVLPDAGDRQRFAAAYLAYRGPVAGFWAQVAADPTLGPKVPAVQLGMQLAALTGGHQPLAQLLLSRHTAGQLSGFADLARLDEGDWAQVIRSLPAGQQVPAAVRGQSLDERVELYARTLERIVEDALPTAVLADRAQRDETASADVRAFWRNASRSGVRFEFGAASVRTLLNEHPQWTDGVADRRALIAELTVDQRLFNLSPRYPEIAALRRAGYRSARDVALAGPNALARELAAEVKAGRVERHRLGPLADKAEHVTAASAAFVTNFQPTFTRPGLYVLPAPDPGRIANLKTLFGPMDSCQCADCQAVTSPAAYLGELMAFLAERPVDRGTALSHLLSRRPDLGDLELSCANTTTTLPFIDLVNELLEDAVAPFHRVNLRAGSTDPVGRADPADPVGRADPADPVGRADPADYAAALDRRRVPAALAREFARHRLPLGARPEVVVAQPGRRWVVSDHSIAYTITLLKNRQLAVVSRAYQTGAPAEQLLANPEHINARAYEALSDVVYPWTLPLDLWREETVTYLGHLDVARHELMRDLTGPDRWSTVDRIEVVAEYLGITRRERQILAGDADVRVPVPPRPGRPSIGSPALPGPGRPVAAGLGGRGNRPEDLLPWRLYGLDEPGWIAKLRGVPELLLRTGLSYDDLVSMLGTRQVNPGGAVRILSRDTTDPATCELDKLVLSARVDAVFFDRLCRFTRLWRRLGWTVAELDQALTVLAGDHGVSAETLRELSHVQRLRVRLDLPVEHLLVFWSDISTAGDDPLYDRLFRNPAVRTPVDPAFALSGSEVAVRDPLAAHAETLLAAYGTTAAELTALTAGLGLADAQLSVLTLSALYRHVRLARALDVSIVDLLALKELTGVDPFDRRTEHAVFFVELVDLLAPLNLPPTDIGYLLAGRDADRVDWAPDDTTRAGLLDALRAGLRKIREDTAARPDPTGELTRDSLAALGWPADLVDRVLDTLTGTLTFPLTTPAGRQYAAPADVIADALRAYRWPTYASTLERLPAGVLIPDPLSKRFYHDPGARMLFATGPLSDADVATLRALSADPGWDSALTALVTQQDAFTPAEAFYPRADAQAELFADTTTPADRLAAVLARLYMHLRAAHSRRLVTAQLAAALGQTEPDTDQLLDAMGVRELFTAEAFATASPNVKVLAAFPDQDQALVRLVKAAHLAGVLGLSAAELGWVVAHAPRVAGRRVPWLPDATDPVGWLRLESLPATGAATPLGFASLMRLAALARVLDGLPGRTATLGHVFAATGTDVSSALDVLATDTGWDRTDVGQVASAFGLSTADLADETGLQRLEAGLRWARKLGASVAQVLAFARPRLREEDARAARHAVKSRYSDDAWAQVAKPLRDKLRTRQRDALAAYLIATSNGRWRDEYDLFGHFLIDVEMSPCAITSRLKQAIGSVQQYVQRGLLNLEPQLAFTAAERTQWTYLKNYRVWEANRRIFLYPENWLEPELRANQTQFFTEAATELTAGEVTDALAEDVFRTYLAKLDSVGQLEIAGMCVDPADANAGTPEVVHVFGRTSGASPAYFHRRRVDGFWEGWQRVDLDIAGPQLLPIVWRRRLYLFWPVFTEVSEHGDAGQIPPVPRKRYEISIAWSMWKNNAWQPKQVSGVGEKLQPGQVSGDDGTLPDPGRYIFRISDQDGRDDEAPVGVWVWYDFREGAREAASDRSAVFDTSDSQGRGYVSVDGRSAAVYPASMPALAPPGAQPYGTGIVEVDRGRPMSLPADIADPTRHAAALNSTPGPLPYRLAYWPQIGWIDGNSLFFYADDTRTYVVDPERILIADLGLADPQQADLAQIEVIAQRYYQFPPFEPPGIGPESAPSRFGHTYPTPLELAQGGRVRSRPIAALPPPDGRGAAALGTPRRALSAHESPALEGGFIAGRSNAIGRLIPKKRVQRYRFGTFFHPYQSQLAQILDRSGVDGLLSRDTQRSGSPLNASFVDRYAPTELVLTTDPDTGEPLPVEDVDFSYTGGYSIYNWELFFHLPLLIATRLYQNQQFEAAQKWFHRIFDPTDSTHNAVPRKFWQTKPFFNQTDDRVLAQRIDTLIAMLATGRSNPQLDAQLTAWRRDALQPHVIAALRPAAYQKNVVMRYLDNLIAWGDQLFRRDTLESINEATQLYVLAAQILGPRPSSIPPRAQPQVRTFNTLKLDLDRFSDSTVEIEYLFGNTRPDAVIRASGKAPLPVPKVLYFCVPPNDNLLRYWETVADRLTKIRTCANIEGVVRPLPLFEPRIDPALLVRAAAAGVDIAAALADAAAPLPTYRFATLNAKAADLCGEVKALGAALLAALEKQDAEHLALLRAGHEATLLDAMERVRVQQHEEALKQIDVLLAARATAVSRWQHYQRLLGKTPPAVPEEGQPVPPETAPALTVKDDDGVVLLDEETSELHNMHVAHALNVTAGALETSASIVHAVPQFEVAAKPWGVGESTSFGGRHLGSALQAGAAFFKTLASQFTYNATRAGRLAGHKLRNQDWVLQNNLAVHDLMHIDKQLIAARVREQVTQFELENHRTQLANARAVADTLKSKYTNEQLYQWMVGQVSTVYFQAYQLAYDVAKRAERAYRHELGLADSTFIQFGYWDTLKKGLLAGDLLHHDLRRMEMDYLERHRREYELTKRVSLAALDPLALVELRATGRCDISLPEEVFDLDCPGHYFRRIKAVSMSIPCVAGPYTSVNATLTLLRSQIRVRPEPGGDYPRQSTSDSRFRDLTGGAQSVVTSTGLEDTGLFEVNLRDERYLPFEGAGTISDWHLELPDAYRQFDYATIADVILHVRYTAREGGAELRGRAVASLDKRVNTIARSAGRSGLFRSLSARHEFPDAWRRFLAGTATTLDLDVGASRVPYLFHGKTVTVTQASIVVLPVGTPTTGNASVRAVLTTPGGASGGGPINLADKVPTTTVDLGSAGVRLRATPETWQIGLDGVTRTQLEDVILVLRYTVR